MNEYQWYRLSKILLLFATILLIGNGLFLSCKRGSSTADSNNAVRTVESIKAEHESARSEAESSEREVTAAEKHVERAADAVTRSEEAASRNAAGVDELQKVVSECQGIVEAQRELIREIDRANGIGTETGKEN